MATYTQKCSSVGGFGYAGNFTLYVTLTDRDGSSETNKSFVDYNVYCQSSGSGSISAKHRRFFSINNSTKIDETSTINASSPNAYISIARGTIEVTHNEDGTKTIPFSAQIQGSSYGVSASISGNFTLNKIDRYAKFSKSWVYGTTLNTVDVLYRPDRTIIAVQYSLNGGAWANISTVSGNWNSPNNDVIYRVSNLNPNTKYTIKTRIQNNGGLWTESPTMNFTTKDIARLTDTPNVNIGSSHVVKWTNPGGATTSLKLCKTNSTVIQDFGTITGTQKTITPTASKIYPLTPKSNTITLRYIITSVQNGKTYTSYRDCKFTVVNSNPTFSNFEYADINSTTINLTGNSKTIVKGHSTVRATISTANKAIAKNSATMSKYRLSIGDKKEEKAYSSTAAVTLDIAKVNANTITVYAIDSRENSTPKQITPSKYLAYESIKIASISATRTNNVGSETTLTFSGYIWNLSFGSVANDIVSCTYKYKKTTATSWKTGTTTLRPTKSGNSFSFSGKISGDLGASGFDIDESYNIQVFISDKLTNNNSSPASFILGSGTPALAIYKNNVAVGQEYDVNRTEKMQINGSVFSQGPNYYKSTGLKQLPSGTDGLDYWKALENGIYWYANTESPENMPSPWGWVIRMGYSPGGDFNVLFFTQSSGPIYRKSGNGSTVTSWLKLNGDAASKGIKTLSAKTNTGWTNQTDGDSFLITKAFMAFWNGRYSNTGSNLTYCHQGEIQAKPVVLFNSPSGVSGTVTLSETSANFSYIEIFFRDSTNGNPFSSVKVFSPNGKKVSTSVLSPDTTNIRANVRRLSISGKTITVEYYRVNYFPVGGEYGVNEQQIFKVIGYR